MLELLKDNYSKFTDSEKAIGDYLLSINDDSIINITSKELGAITGTSASTVVRFAQKLGFNSFNELKFKMSLSIKEDSSDENFEYLDKELSTRDIIYGIKNSITSNVEKVANLISEEELDKAIKLLIEAKNIYIFGVGSSSLVAFDFYYKLMRINKKAIVHMDTHLQITSSVLLEDGDVVVAISYSGETNEVVKCVGNAKKRNIPVISITKASVNNSLAKLSDITLQIPIGEKILREGAMSSRISQLAIIDMLYIGIARNDILGIEDKLVKTRVAIEDFQR